MVFESFIPSAEDQRQFGFLLGLLILAWLATKLDKKPPTTKITAKQEMFREG